MSLKCRYFFNRKFAYFNQEKFYHLVRLDYHPTFVKYVLFFSCSGIVDENHTLIYPHLYTDEFVAKLEAVDWENVEEDEAYNMTDFTIRTGHQLEDFIQSVSLYFLKCIMQ